MTQIVVFANALKYRDPNKVMAWVQLGLVVSPESYELRVADNGIGLPSGERAEVSELCYRAAPARAAGLGVGQTGVKLLVEQSGETLTVDSGEGQGTTFVAVLPRSDLEDYLTGGPDRTGPERRFDRGRSRRSHAGPDGGKETDGSVGQCRARRFPPTNRRSRGFTEAGAEQRTPIQFRYV